MGGFLVLKLPIGNLTEERKVIPRSRVSNFPDHLIDASNPQIFLDALTICTAFIGNLKSQIVEQAVSKKLTADYLL